MDGLIGHRIDVEFLVGLTLRDTVTQPVALLHSVDWRLLRRYTSVGK